MAQSKGLFGRYFRSEFKSPVAGVVEFITPKTGHVGVRQSPTPVTKDAYIRGTVAKVIPEEGVVVACEGALVQGSLAWAANGRARSSSRPPAGRPAHRNRADSGACRQDRGGRIHRLRRRPPESRRSGHRRIVCGGVVDRDLMDYLAKALNQPGFDIGVAITGHEPIPFTLVSRSFGTISMAHRTFSLLRSLEGKVAAINGATQIRAGVIRPEIIVSLEDPAPAASNSAGDENAGQLRLAPPSASSASLTSACSAPSPPSPRTRSGRIRDDGPCPRSPARRRSPRHRPRANVELIESS